MGHFQAHLRSAIGSTALAALLAGCSGGAGAPARQPQASPAPAAQASPAAGAASTVGLVGLSIAPPGPVRLLRGERLSLTAVGVDGRGALVGAPPVERWVVRPPGIVEVDATGRAAAVGEGTARIQAQVGALLSGEMEVAVVRISGVEVVPGRASLAVLDDSAEPAAAAAGTLQFTATVRFSDGGSESQVAWDSGDPGRVRVVDGRVSAVPGAAPGEVTITARSLRDGAATGTAAVTLEAAGQTRVVVQ